MAAIDEEVRCRRSFVTVQGRGTFPLDMLRYDSCFPASETDTHTIRRTGPRRVLLVRMTLGDGMPSVARWRSFGWDVVETVPRVKNRDNRCIACEDEKAELALKYTPEKSDPPKNHTCGRESSCAVTKF